MLNKVFRFGGVYTVSIHWEDIFPTRKQIGDRDIGLPEGTGDAIYLETLAAQIEELLSLSGPAPDLVFFNAGVDPHGEDRLGKLALSDGGLARRDALIIGACAERGLPVACVVGGGCARDTMSLAQWHGLLYAAADHCYRNLVGGFRENSSSLR